MRTLKKTLCLVLALVLCLGLVGTAFAANYDKYTDAATVGEDYAEAVDVMMGAGIISGMSETEIGATGTLTREQAAKIVTYMLLGAKVADALKADAAPFKDVAADRWSAGYIAYCAKAGILDGIGGGKFDPAGELTGYAFAKMLLVALGYKGTYTGEGWSINVAKDAFNAGIFVGDETAAVNAPVQRQQAMLLAFNAFFKGEPVVTTTTSNKYVTTLAGVNTIHDTYTAAAAAITGGASYQGTISVTETTTVMKGSLAEKVYGITRSYATSDNYNVPTTTYTQAGKALPIAIITEAATKEYTTAVTEAKVFADLGLKRAVTGASISVDGAAETQATLAYNGGTIAASGNGVKLTVIYDAVTNTVAMYAQNTYLGTVSTVTPATAITPASVTIVGAAGTEAFHGKTFVTTGLKVNDKVLVTYSAKANGGVGAIQSVTKVEPTTVKASSYTATSFTADGTTYKYSKNLVGGTVAAFTPVNVYLDAYGYVIDSNAINTPDTYAIFLASTTVNNWPAPSTTKAQIVKADGSVEIVENAALVNTPAAGSVVTVTAGTGANTGKTVLTKVADAAASATVLTKGVVNFTVGGVATKANNKTLFIVKTVNPATYQPVYTAYVGIADVPTITTSTNTTVYDKAGDGYQDVVYVDVATLYAPPATAKTVAYITAAGKATCTDAVKGVYYTYNAIVDGTVTTIESSKGDITDGFYGVLTTDAKGLVSAVTPLAATGLVLDSKTGTTAALNGVVKFDTTELTYTDATVVYKLTPAGFVASSVLEIGTDANDTVVYYTTNGVLTFAVITVNA